MSAHVVIDQTPDGWEVSAKGDDVHFVTNAEGIHVDVGPDAPQPQAPEPLAVTLAG